MSDYSIQNEGGTLFPDNDIFHADIDYILRGLGMQPGDADEYLLSLIASLIADCKPMIEARAAFIVYNSPQFNPEDNTITLCSTVLNVGKVVWQSLKHSSELALFSATCGDKIEKYSKQLMKQGQALEGLVVDLIGSSMTEAIVDYLHDHVEKAAIINGLKVSNRYSPGYCNWNITDQHKLFSLLKNYTCGISLTESSLMLPVKSVSGIIGLGESLKRITYKCNICSDKNCIMRIHSTKGITKQ